MHLQLGDQLRDDVSTLLVGGVAQGLVHELSLICTTVGTTTTQRSLRRRVWHLHSALNLAKTPASAIGVLPAPSVTECISGAGTKTGKGLLQTNGRRRGALACVQYLTY